MTEIEYHLAQANIARTCGRFDSPIMSGLVARIEEMNELAESYEGFVWRQPGADVTAEALLGFEQHHSPFEADRVFYNMSVWESIEALRTYVFKTSHAEMLRAKDDWIEDSDEPALVLWWVPAGSIPTIADSARRWQTLRNEGPTEVAFTLSRLFPKPTT